MTRQTEIWIKFRHSLMRVILLLILFNRNIPAAESQTEAFNTASNFWKPSASRVNMALPQPASILAPLPSPYTQPTMEQTRWYVDNNPYFANVPQLIKEVIISGARANTLSGFYLPGGFPNPLVNQYGGVIPNWYLPCTWTSPQMNWQGVQRNGFLPDTSQSNLTDNTTRNWNLDEPSTYSAFLVADTNYQPGSTSNTRISSQESDGARLFGRRLLARIFLGTAVKGTGELEPESRYVINPGEAEYPVSVFLKWQKAPTSKWCYEADNSSAIPSLPSGVTICPTRGIAHAHIPSRNDLLNARETARASALRENADGKIAEAIDHSELARMFVQKGDPEQSLREINLTDPAAVEGGSRALEADKLEIKAAALMSSGDLEQALAVYREVMHRFRLQNDEAGQAETFVSLGWVLQALGRDDEAFNAYREASDRFQSLSNRDGTARALIGLGSLYSSMGDSEKAVQKYTEASRFSSDDRFARILVSYAELLQSEGSQARALIAYRDALSRLHSGGDHRLLGAIYAGMGRSARALDQYIEARQHFEAADTQMNLAGDRRGQAGVLASIAELDYWTGLELNHWTGLSGIRSIQLNTFARAMAGFTNALALMRETGDREGEIGVLTDLGRLFETEGELPRALDSYCQALDKLEDLRNSARLEEFRINLAGQSESLYSRVVELKVRTHKMKEAFNFSERARARSFLDVLGNTRNNSPGEVFTDLVTSQESLRAESTRLERQLGQESSKPLTAVDSKRARSLQTQLSAVKEDYQQTLGRLKASNPAYASFLSVSPLNLVQVQQQLGPDVTSLSYFTLPDMTLAFVVSGNSFDAFKLPVNQDKLVLAVSTFLDFAGEEETREMAKTLYNMLIAPLRSQLTNRTLLISPYGVLHNLPFGALSSDGEHFLADSYTIALLPSISAWPYLRSTNKHEVTNALVMANEDVEGLPLLDSGRGEANAVASLFQSKPLFGKAASLTTLREHGGEYSIVHLMAHLDHDMHNPRSSHIVLDQDLNIDEVLGLNLQKTSLVVLSGCQSDKGERTRGDDVIALSRAFMYAGAPSVVASLWSVDDESTSQLMVAFYSHLRDGLSKAEALQAAQTDVRRSFPNPYYWASFVLMGDPGASTKSPGAMVSRP
jgi:CHAT domain-containing protein